MTYIIQCVSLVSKLTPLLSSIVKEFLSPFKEDFLNIIFNYRYIRVRVFECRAGGGCER